MNETNKEKEMNAKDMNKLMKETHEKIAFDKKVENEVKNQLDELKTYFTKRERELIREHLEAKNNDDKCFISGRIIEIRRILAKLN